jgi:hypothetical protein
MGMRPLKKLVIWIIVSIDESHDFKETTLTPKGLGVPYVGFSDSGQAAMNAFYF